ncbi:SAM-dependent methyltransferase [Gordonia spumicola]|uniref:SAM-dependent methyltransferase n=1 Tax=Gordonia spumicola TaxID=589161 RepID=A0A7I9VEG6_9ACTN|nr:methyltransferase domain-containing protein [Gordonia spumicola]GEE03717.1 SAM-dependent methyltransferase [Gordonia spumicola]
MSLLSGKGTAHRSDTAEMVAARVAVFDAGLYEPVVSAVADSVPDGPGTVVDAAAGTGAYLSAALRGDRVGVAVDLSKSCARVAARCHPRVVSVVADLWSQIPVADGSAGAVLSVFAPRNAAETARILAPGGRWVIVTPNPGHLAEIVEPMGMLRVGDAKARRLAADLDGAFDIVSTRRVTAVRELTAERLADVAGMGPAGFHRSRTELESAAGDLAGDASVIATLDVTLTVARRAV